MSNLLTKSGENNCYWNYQGICTKDFDGKPRVWWSKMKCAFTQDGAQELCSSYRNSQLR